MDIKGLLLLITTGVNLGLAFFILFTNWRNKINFWFAATLFSIAVWSFCIAMFRASVDPRLLGMWSDLYYFAAALIALAFFYFTRAFPVEIMKLPKYVHLATLAATITLAFIIFSAVPGIKGKSSKPICFNLLID